MGRWEAGRAHKQNELGVRYQEWKGPIFNLAKWQFKNLHTTNILNLNAMISRNDILARLKARDRTAIELVYKCLFPCINGCVSLNSGTKYSEKLPNLAS
jgi:hypothetical protein